MKTCYMKVEKKREGTSKAWKWAEEGNKEKLRDRGREAPCMVLNTERERVYMVTANQDGGADEERVCCSLQLESSASWPVKDRISKRCLSLLISPIKREKHRTVSQCLSSLTTRL